jgi:hypothetical protein
VPYMSQEFHHEVVTERMTMYIASFRINRSVCIVNSSIVKMAVASFSYDGNFIRVHITHWQRLCIGYKLDSSLCTLLTSAKHMSFKRIVHLVRRGFLLCRCNRIKTIRTQELITLSVACWKSGFLCFNLLPIGKLNLIRVRLHDYPS